MKTIENIIIYGGGILSIVAINLMLLAWLLSPAIDGKYLLN